MGACSPTESPGVLEMGGVLGTPFSGLDPRLQGAWTRTRGHRQEPSGELANEESTPSPVLRDGPLAQSLTTPAYQSPSPSVRAQVIQPWVEGLRAC